jgi:uncharacterized membrane protein YbhN (UPF0104 family)
LTRGRLLKQAVAVALVAAAVWYLGRSVAHNWNGLRAFHWRLDPLLLAGSVLAQVGVLVCGVFVWMLVMRGFRGSPVGFRPLLHVWSVSSLARYVPGGAVWQLAAASQMAESRGLSRLRMVTSLLIHSGLAALAAGVVGVLVLPLKAFRVGWLPAWSPWLVVLVVFAVHPRVVNAGLGVLNRLTGRDLLHWELGWAPGVLILALECVNWLLFGVAYWLFLRSLAPFPAAAILQVPGVFSLSFLAGFLSPSAGGVGVREALMARLLQPYLPAEVAAVVSILARLWTTVAELLTAALGTALVSRVVPAAPGADAAPEAAAVPGPDAEG